MDDRATWMGDVDFEQDSGGCLCAHRGQMSRVPDLAAPGLLGLKNQVEMCARSDWAVTTTPTAAKAWPQPNLEVSLNNERLPHAGTLASEIHHQLRTARRVPGQGISSP